MAEIRQIQVDGVNYDLVISEDEVSATRAEQAAQRAANSATQAASNSAQASEYSITAGEYAQDAQDAADRAEAIVGGQFVSYGEDQGLTDANKAQARKNIGAANTNPNILMNWDFTNPVNSRGQTTYTEGGYRIDKWRVWNTGTTTTLTDNGLILSNNTSGDGLFQYLDSKTFTNLYGKTVTVSAIINGTLITATGVASADCWIGYEWSGVVAINYVCTGAEAFVRMQINGNSSITIKSVKLEIGPVSTLSYDSTADYGTELARCIYSPNLLGDTYAGNGFGRSNRNLLDNWYFVGGGSQLGDWIFPINQRGQTSYSGNGNTGIDRWKVWLDATVTLNANGVSVSGGTNIGIVQYVPQSYRTTLQNKTMTYSVLFTDGTLATHTFALTTEDSYNDLTAANGIKLEFAFDGYPYFLIYSQSGQNFGVVAAKLELGTVSTLANDAPPDFGAELAKCQRRLFRVSPRGTSSRGYAGFGSANSSKNILVFVPTPVTLAAQPTVSFSNCNAYNYVAGGSIAISSISIDSWTQNGVFLSCTPSDTSQVVQYQPYVLRVAQGGYLQFAADL